MTALLRPMFLAALVLVPKSAVAETIRLRSGDHGAFTRLVADLPHGAAWQLGRTATGYEFRSGTAETVFDTGTVFRKIGHSRVRAVGPGSLPGAFAFDLACACHATASALPSGAIVIDITEGSAPANSPFEAPLAAAEPAPIEEYAAEGAHAERDAPATPPTLHRTEGTVPPHLDLFWKDISPRRATADASPDMQGQGEETGAATESAGTSAPLSEEAAEALPPQAARVASIEGALVRDLGRAASQGLIEVELPDPQSMPGDAATSPVRHQILSQEGAAAHLGVHTETSIDRGAVRSATRRPVTATGAECMPDKAFDIAHWGDDRPAALQIAEGRDGLVGEFDRPDRARVLALARLYLHLGFGAEARATLAAFDEASDEAAQLASMGAIIDGRPEAADFSAMMSCDGYVALWALMGGTEAEATAPLKSGAVVRSFSALPQGLRHVLGPELVRRLTRRGETLAADAIRDALARTAGPGDPDLDLITARVDLAHGRSEAAETQLATLAGSNAPNAAEALILVLDSQIARGQAVPTSLAASAEALAFERRAGPEGPNLHRLVILARASGGNFDAAFAGLADWPESAPAPLREATARAVFSSLLKQADDDTLLRGYLTNRDAFEASNPDLMLRVDLAGRLVAAGVAGDTRKVLSGEAAHTERGRIALARAALFDFDAGAALAILGGLDGAEAAAVRVEARAMAGGNATDGHNAEAAAAGHNAAFGTQPSIPRADAAIPASNAHPAGTLAAARALVGASRATRDSVSSVISKAGG